MNEEYAALMENKTWDLETLPPGARKLPVKWIFKRKRDAAGNIERYKARLVVLGCRQREGIDYNEIYAPVGKHATVRTLLAVVAAKDLELHQLDVANAFLNGQLEEDVWMDQVPGYKVEGRDLACHLRKSLYGLKQSPRAWYLNLRSELECIGFTASEADSGLFVHCGKLSDTYVLIHVDDILIAGQMDGVTMVKTLLAKVFKVKDLGQASFYLGMDLVRDRQERTLVLTQKRYVADLMAKYVSPGARTKSLPLDGATPMQKAGMTLEAVEPSYAEIVGSLMYLAVCTRPDISQAVGVLARYMSKPTEDHYKAAKHVLAYLHGTPNYGLKFGGGDRPELQGYCDADFAGELDSRRSTTGFVFTLNGGVITWSSRLQPTVAASTTEAEYMAAASAVKEALWLRKLLPEFGIAVPTVKVFCDNQAAIKLLKNPVSAARTKHIDVAHHFARERVARGEVAFEYIRTELMIADAMTKALPRQKFEFCRLGMGVVGVTDK